MWGRRLGCMARQSYESYLQNMRVKEQVEADKIKAGWHEVFFSLSYSTALGAAATQFLRQLELQQQGAQDAERFGAALALMLPLFMHWLGHQMYLNRYDNSDAVHNVYQMLNVLFFALAGAGIPFCSRQDGEVDFVSCSQFAFFMFFSRLTTLLMTLRAYFFLRRAGLFQLRAASLLAAASGLWLLNGLLDLFATSRLLTWLLWWLPTALEALSISLVMLFFPMDAHPSSVPARIGLLSERFGLTFIVTLGNMVVTSTKVIITDPVFDAQYVTVASMIIIAFTFKLIYFDVGRVTIIDDTRHALRWHSWAGWLWTLMHLALNVSIVFMTSSYSVVFASPGTPQLNSQRWVLCASTGAVLLSLCILQLLHKRRHVETRVHWLVRLSIRFLSGLLFILLPLVPPESFPLWALSLTMAGVMILLILLEYFGDVHTSLASDSAAASGNSIARSLRQEHYSKQAARTRENTPARTIDDSDSEDGIFSQDAPDLTSIPTTFSIPNR